LPHQIAVECQLLEWPKSRCRPLAVVCARSLNRAFSDQMPTHPAGSTFGGHHRCRLGQSFQGWDDRSLTAGKGKNHAGSVRPHQVHPRTGVKMLWLGFVRTADFMEGLEGLVSSPDGWATPNLLSGCSISIPCPFRHSATRKPCACRPSLRLRLKRSPVPRCAPPVY
jgi:hypothetical protein